MQDKSLGPYKLLRNINIYEDISDTNFFLIFQKKFFWNCFRIKFYFIPFEYTDIGITSKIFCNFCIMLLIENSINIYDNFNMKGDKQDFNSIT